MLFTIKPITYARGALWIAILEAKILNLLDVFPGDIPSKKLPLHRLMFCITYRQPRILKEPLALARAGFLLLSACARVLVGTRL